MELKNHRLAVTFADPAALQNLRFDRTAMVTQVILDDKYAFCTPEQVLPGRRTTQGMGLCGEFVLEGPAEEAEAGQWFVKPGVGLLRQPQTAMPYDMWRSYEAQFFPVAAQKGDDRITFTQRAVPGGGYGVDIRKTFSLRENRLILDISAVNSGEKPITLREYQHNFLSLAGKPVGPGYILELACDKRLPEIEGQTLRQGDEIVLPSAVRVEGSRVLWGDDLNGKVMYHRSEDIDPDAPYRWTLRHRDTGVSVSGETDFCPSRIDIWAVEHCICPEFYHTLRLAPGESAQWRRVWTFSR